MGETWSRILCLLISPLICFFDPITGGCEVLGCPRDNDDSSRRVLREAVVAAPGPSLSMAWKDDLLLGEDSPHKTNSNVYATNKKKQDDGPVAKVVKNSWVDLVVADPAVPIEGK
jgi:hypothetical protein